MGFKAKHMDGTTYWHASEPSEGLDYGCSGTGYVNCHCGGDQCVCGNFGEVECHGCEDCDNRGEWDPDVEDDIGRMEDEEGEWLDAPRMPDPPKVLPAMREWAKANGLL